MVYCPSMIDTTAFKTKLEQMLADITDELKGLGVHNPDVPEDWIATPATDEGAEADPNLEADRVEDWNERRAILAQLETRYNNIRRALKKIDDGTYGTCEISGNPIEPARLEANPAARTCAAHMEEEGTLPQQ